MDGHSLILGLSEGTLMPNRFVRRWVVRFQLMGLIGVLALASVAQAQDTQLKVELMKGLSTGTSHKGDLVSGRVTDPVAFQGDIVEGKVTNVQQSGGKAVLRFSFETLKHGGQAVPIASEVQSISNSQGQADVDENGNAIRQTNRQEKASGIGRAGSALGGLLGGRSGTAVDAASQAAAAVIMVDVSTDASSITLAPGSTVTLLARSRSGPALSSLAPNAAPATATAQPEAPAPQAGGQPNLTAVKSDFVPGDRVILYDDFTDMAGDEPPPHWKVRGGTAELRVGGGTRQMTMTADHVTLTPNVAALPANFTMEADVAYKGLGATASWKFYDKADAVIFQVITAVNYSKFSLTIRTSEEELTSQQIEMDWSKPVKQALWVQNGRVRYYVNGQRAMDVNQIALPELGKIELDVVGPGDNDPTGYVGIQFFRFAESSPDFSKVILSSGRFVTHGILFDTDSDQIKPESAPIIKMVAKGLEADPALKLRIEGHTDSVGNADHNLDLSRRRAEAVKAVLVAQFNIDASRLTTAGLGATKPVDSNDTPQGRAQNRRVEFVKQ
jgi:outer membrane protein OmpA-like peptidoglycan-associated protein